MLEKIDNTETRNNQIKVPPNFKQILVECLDPAQSCDYYEISSILFPIQVLPLGLEKKVLRLSAQLADNYDLVLIRTVGELCHFYYPELQLNWPAQNASREQLEEFYIKHVEKFSFNDEVIKVVNQIIVQINWKPIDEKQKAEMNRYIAAEVFLPIFVYLNSIEQKTPDFIFQHMTRGLFEIVKLNNMIQNDRMRFLSSDDSHVYTSDTVDKKMAQAQTLDEYKKGLDEQGFSLGDLL